VAKKPEIRRCVYRGQLYRIVNEVRLENFYGDALHRLLLAQGNRRRPDLQVPPDDVEELPVHVETGDEVQHWRGLWSGKVLSVASGKVRIKPTHGKERWIAARQVVPTRLLEV
jgi:hypothetical protein